MTGYVRAAVAPAFSVALFVDTPALAQKPGGILRISHFEQPGEHVDARRGDGAANRPTPERHQPRSPGAFLQPMTPIAPEGCRSWRSRRSLPGDRWAKC